MLTDRERRLLAELERRTAETDPRLAARLRGRGRAGGTRALPPHARDLIAVAAVVGGLALMFVALPWSHWLAFGGVATTYAGAVTLAPRASVTGARIGASVAHWVGARFRNLR